jgi:hypothetical protein
MQLTFLSSLCSTLLNDHLIKLQFLRSSLQDSLFDSILSDEPEDIDLLSLTDSMSSVHGLQIGLRVPIRIKQNDNIGSDQIDTQSTSSSCQEEDKLLAAWSIIVIDGGNSGFVIGSTIDSAVFYRC